MGRYSAYSPTLSTVSADPFLAMAKNPSKTATEKPHVLRYGPSSLRTGTNL